MSGLITVCQEIGVSLGSTDRKGIHEELDDLGLLE